MIKKILCWLTGHIYKEKDLEISRLNSEETKKSSVKVCTMCGKVNKYSLSWLDQQN